MSVFYMKVHLTICVDIEVARKLREEKNKSQLINSFLRKYFNLKPKNETTKNIHT